MLKTHEKDSHGNVVAEEGLTTCICGCKYWEADACIDCGMTPERLWIIQSGARHRVMQRLQLNTAFTTMLHYDLPWTDAHVSDTLDAINVQSALADLPRHNLRWAKTGEII